MAEKVEIKIVIDQSQNFTKENYEALKSVLDAYIGEVIRVNSIPTSNNPYAGRVFHNRIPFKITCYDFIEEPINYDPNA